MPRPPLPPGPTVSPEAPEEKPSGARAFLRSRRGALLRWTALVLGLLLIGWSAGYLLMPRTATADQISIPKEAFDRTATRGDMPSLVGLNRDTATAALGDAGISGIPVEYADRPAAGPPGTVIGQTPAAGIAVDERIVLTVSVPAPMPDIVGQPNREARSALEDLGAIVTITTAVDPAATAGAVLRTEPAAGTTMPLSVTMVVADPGDALSLSTVSSVDSSSCSTSRSSSVAGRTLANNLTCTPGSSKKAEVEYAINRNATVFEATVGTDDTEGTGRATVTVFGDGRPLKTLTVNLGKSEDIRVDVRNVMRLGIVVTADGGDQSPTVVLGDARLRGSADGLDQIAGRR
ncbi:PASTA domain-containing protein [Gordonia phosphorivorans]|uniref:PASTA domain-containing protein n=1 Tax=Gordonia phosphorivorans TaxID=1056982 RepID=A0ABV6H936_9ACTN